MSLGENFFHREHWTFHFKSQHFEQQFQSLDNFVDNFNFRTIWSSFNISLHCSWVNNFKFKQRTFHYSTELWAKNEFDFLIIYNQQWN